MFAFRRGRLPFLIPLALAAAFGYLLAGGVGSAFGALLFLPFLIMKIVFTMLFFGFVLKMFAHKSGHTWHSHHGRRPGSTREPEGEPQDRDWEEALRAAKREIDKLFPNPGHDDADREQ